MSGGAMATSERAGERIIMMRRLLLVGAAFGAQILSAMAADVAPFDRGPAVAVFSWTGAYIGADIGGAWSNIQSTFGGGNASSVIDGAYTGYSWQLAPQWSIGIEGDATWADLTAPAGSGDVNWLGSLRGRIGWSPAATTMLYFTGGAAWGTVSIPGVDRLPATQTKTGWVVGAGLEWAPWANNWLVRAEYLNYSFTGILLGAGSPSDLTISEARAGVAYKF
jgi:outer membrane immunogenic protein